VPGSHHGFSPGRAARVVLGSCSSGCALDLFPQLCRALQTVPGQIDSEFIGLSTVCCDVGESGKVGVIELHETGVPGGY
jgi:hypothetical protein